MTQQRFLEMLQSHPGILASEQRFSGMLRDCFPQTPSIVRLMISLYEMGVHSEIENVLRVTNDFAYRFVKRLVDEHGTDRQRAENAVAIFCVCYGRDILKKPCDLEINPIVEGSGLNVCVWDISVPNVAGMTESEAISTINSEGLSVGSVTREHHPTVPSGKVIASSLASGSLVKQGTTVALRLSKGPKMVIVPDVRHMTKDEAEKEICSAGLSVDSVTSEYHFYEQSGNVIDSIPASGSPVKQGMTVVLRLSKGPEMVAVPDVRGKTQKEAEAKIRSAVLSVYSVTSEPPPAAPSGDVRSPDGHQGDWSWRELWNLTLGFAGLCLIPIALFAAEQKWSYYSSTIAGEMLIFVSGFLSFKSKKSCAVIAAIFVIVEFLLVSFALFSARVIFKEMSFGWLIVVLGLPIIFLSGILAHYLLERDDSELFIASFPLAAMGAVGFFFFKPDIYNYRLGHAYYSNGDYDRAIAAYNKGIMFSPDRKVGDNYTVYNNRVANSYNGRGDAYYSKGDYDSAIADYSQAIDINPDNAIIYSNRANAYASKGGFDSAIADLTEAIKLNPNNNGFKERLAGLKQLVKVPIVANMAEARKKIPAAGLTLIVNYVYHNSMPKGNVIDSSPAFGSFVPRGTKVTLRVSSGPALISVPNVAGMTEEGAKAAINSAGLEVDVTHENNNSMKNGCVIDSSPAFGSFVPPGTKVTLRVSSGPALISVPPPPDAASEPNAAGMKDARATIPYVAGMTKERAEAEIKSKGLNAVVKYDGNHKVKKGNVIDSSPKNGTLVKPGATVILLVSSRRRIITRTPVPYVDGMTEERAEAEIKSKGFLKVDVLYENNNSVKNRYVIGTIPAYGNSLKPEETVTLRVSSGPYIGEKSK